VNNDDSYSEESTVCIFYLSNRIMNINLAVLVYRLGPGMLQYNYFLQYQHLRSN